MKRDKANAAPCIEVSIEGENGEGRRERTRENAESAVKGTDVPRIKLET